MFVSHVFLNVFNFHSEFKSKRFNLLVLIPKGATVVFKIIGPLFVLVGRDFDKILQTLNFLFQIFINPIKFLINKYAPQNSSAIDSFLYLIKKYFHFLSHNMNILLDLF